ncbi:hypothetical protein D3C83_04480 [compost metagenome]
MPRPASADIRCSTVAIFTPCFSRLEESRVSPTAYGSPLITTGGVKSVRRNTMPLLAAAGRKVM